MKQVAKRDRELDPQLIEAALRRAGAKARELAEQTGTPFYVFKDGAIVDLNADRERKGRPREHK